MFKVSRIPTFSHCLGNFLNTKPLFIFDRSLQYPFPIYALLAIPTVNSVNFSFFLFAFTETMLQNDLNDFVNLFHIKQCRHNRWSCSFLKPYRFIKFLFHENGAWCSSMRFFKKNRLWVEYCFQMWKAQVSSQVTLLNHFLYHFCTMRFSLLIDLADRISFPGKTHYC